MINFIILLAARGSRLKKITKNIPARFVEINKSKELINI